MRRRLRKKKYLGEFRVLAFEVHADLRDGLSAAEREAFLDRWLDAVEARKLAFGGGFSRGHGKLGGFVERDCRGSSTIEDDRRALGEFLDSDAAVVRHEIGALVDANR